MPNYHITEDELDILHFIQQNPKTSQRGLAKRTGLSIGKVNYCIKALLDVGFIKVNNFRNSKNKTQYMYSLTPKGMRNKTEITKKFIVKKVQEYDKLNSYINT